MIIYVSLLVCLIGLVMVLVSDKPPGSPNMKALGHEMFWVGLLVFLIQLPGSHIVSLFK